MAERRQSTEARRQQIAEAALKIISTRGVHRLTAMELAREVGIADGTIFRHFKDKAEIVDAAIEHLASLLQEDFPSRIDDPVDRLQEFFVRRLRRVVKHPVLFRLAFSDRLEEAAGDSSAARVRAMMERSQSFVRECLKEAQEANEISRALPLEALTLTVVGALQAGAMAASAASALGGKNLPVPEALWATVETLLRASAGLKRR